MNDFTKEELETLRDGLNYAVGNPCGFTADTVMPLYNKLQFLIDNYCEHEMGYGGSQEVYQCKKCGEIE